MKYYVLLHSLQGWENGYEKTGEWKAKYSDDYLKIDRGKIKEGKALFIDNGICWNGSVTNINLNSKAYGKSGVEFNYNLTTGFELPYNHEIVKLKAGWYEMELDFDPEKKPAVALPQNLIAPDFFNHLLETNSWRLFENYGFMLLKLLGIHNIRKYEQGNNKGRADGFFQFKGLNVLFDFTLEDAFVERKTDQINNYVSQLKKGVFVFGNRHFSISSNDSSQVWIITRNTTQILQNHGDVVVKEIFIEDLMDLYLERLENDDMDEAQLKKKLDDIAIDIGW